MKKLLLLLLFSISSIAFAQTASDTTPLFIRQLLLIEPSLRQTVNNAPTDSLLKFIKHENISIKYTAFRKLLASNISKEEKLLLIESNIQDLRLLKMPVGCLDYYVRPFIYWFISDIIDGRFNIDKTDLIPILLENPYNIPEWSKIISSDTSMTYYEDIKKLVEQDFHRAVQHLICYEKEEDHPLIKEKIQQMLNEGNYYTASIKSARNTLFYERYIHLLENHHKDVMLLDKKIISLEYMYKELKYGSNDFDLLFNEFFEKAIKLKNKGLNYNEYVGVITRVFRHTRNSVDEIETLFRLWKYLDSIWPVDVDKIFRADKDRALSIYQEKKVKYESGEIEISPSALYHIKKMTAQ